MSNHTPTSHAAQAGIDLDSIDANPLAPALKLALGSLGMYDFDEAARIGALARNAACAAPALDPNQVQTIAERIRNTPGLPASPAPAAQAVDARSVADDPKFHELADAMLNEYWESAPHRAALAAYIDTRAASPAPETAQADDGPLSPLRCAVRQMARALANGEWADLLTPDHDAAELERQIGKLIERAHAQQDAAPALYVRLADIDGTMPGSRVVTFKSPDNDWNVPLYTAPSAAPVVTDAMVDACYNYPEKVPAAGKNMMRKTLERALAAFPSAATGKAAADNAGGQAVAWRFRTRGAKYWQVTKEAEFAATMGAHDHIEIEPLGVLSVTSAADAKDAEPTHVANKDRVSAKTDAMMAGLCKAESVMSLCLDCCNAGASGCAAIAASQKGTEA